MYDYTENYNRVNLVKAEATLTKREFAEFTKHEFMEYEVLKTWTNEDFEEAQRELEKLRCSYRLDNQLFDIVEYALIYFNVDEDGEEFGACDIDVARDEMLFLKNNCDAEFCIDDLEKAKKFILEGNKETLKDLQEEDEEAAAELEEYLEEVDTAESLEELARIWNRYTDIFENGSMMEVVAI